jgi:hypothetical protein
VSETGNPERLIKSIGNRKQQAAAHARESQVSAPTQRVQSDGAPMPPERQFVDNGISRAALARPGLDRLRDLAAVGAIDRIYVHSPDLVPRTSATIGSVRSLFCQIVQIVAGADAPLLAKDSETEGPEVGLQEFR